jgi:hypothetical protein
MEKISGRGLGLLLTYSLIPNAGERERARAAERPEEEKHLNRMIMRRRALQGARVKDVFDLYVFLCLASPFRNAASHVSSLLIIVTSPSLRI